MFVRIIEMNCSCGNNFNFRLCDPRHGNLFVRFLCPAEVLTKDGVVKAEPGDFIFYRADEEIGYSSGNWKFRHDYFRFYLEEGEEILFDLQTSVLHKAPMSSKMDEILQMMTREFYSANKNRTTSTELLGKLFLLAAKERLSDPEATKTPKIKSDLLRVRIEMLSAPEKNLTVEELAAKAHLSPSYFQGLYKKTFGISPINDLIEAKIKKSEIYILSSDKKETEIAALCGYNNTEHFIRQFKKLRGITPSELKRSAKK